MTAYGYARVSTDGQTLDSQQDKLDWQWPEQCPDQGDSGMAGRRGRFA
jgi:DNA invertase Pin-like site-specific DNA recombinase